MGRRSWWAATILALVPACSAAQLAIKRPVADQCTARGLRRCEDLTDGVMAYLDGDKATAEMKLRAAAAGNSPEDVRQFANALKPLAENVGGESGTALRGVITFLTENGAPAAAGGAPPERKAATAGVATTLDTADGRRDQRSESDRMRTYTVPAGLDDHASDCGSGPLANDAGVCRRTRVAVGPLIVTNVYASGGCPDDLFVATGRLDRPQWFILAPSGSPLNVNGKFSVDDGEELFIGVRAVREPKLDVRCAVTWSGYRGQ